MNRLHTRREFLADVGQGMLIASVGFGTAVEMGLAPAQAEQGHEALAPRRAPRPARRSAGVN